MIGDGAGVGPVQEAAGGIGAEAMCDRSDPHTAKVEPVGVPARLQCGITGREPVGVQPAGFEQHLEPLVVEMNESASKVSRQLGATQSMMVVPLLVDTPGIVEDRKKRNDIPVTAVE